MKYFNGFSLEGEEVFFKNFIINSDFTVVGFSYGAQKAFEYAFNSKNRIDRLILLSPAFFQYHKKSFIKRELRFFKKNEDYYMGEFIKNVIYPSDIDLSSFLNIGTYGELCSLLSYVWDKNRILELKNRGIPIEVNR